MPSKTKKQRTTHYLRPNAGTSIPRNLVFLATHAHGTPVPGAPREKIERLDVGVAHGLRLQDGRRERWQSIEFTEAEPFWAWLLSRIRNKSSLWLIGHGIAKSFTLLDGWKLISSRVFRLDGQRADSRSATEEEREQIDQQTGWLVDGDPPTIMLLHTDAGTIHVVDTCNYVDASVAQLALEAKFALPDKPTEVTNPKPWFHWLNAQVRAQVNWLTGLMLWWHAEDLGTWRHTAAANAMAAYRHRFMDARIMVHDCAPALEMEREALAGGEVTCYRVGRVLPLLHGDRGRKPRRGKKSWEIPCGPVHHFDVNSLYPAIMATKPMPRQFVGWLRPGTMADYHGWSGDLLLVARVLIDSDDEAYPMMCNGQRYWAVGRYWTALCGPELARAVQLGHVVQFDGIAGYLPANLFTAFVNYFHLLRLGAKDAGDGLRASWASQTMRALAGKWGQRTPQWDFTGEVLDANCWGSWPVVDVDAQTIKLYRAIAGYVQLKGISGESLESCPAIEAYINAYSREFMREVREYVGRENVVYQSTDALHLLPAGADRVQPFLESYPGELGKFRLKGVHQTAEYRGIHDYTLDDVDTIAGKMSDVKRDARGNFTQWESPTLKSILTHEPGGFLRIRQVHVTMGGYHPRGIINDDGSVSPPQAFDGAVHFDRQHAQPIPHCPAGTRK